MSEFVSTPYRNVSVDQQLAPRIAATHLSRKFDRVFGQVTAGT
ncbi:hypothetical protein ACWDR0_07145 [Streptomyces sp. NPDC003691]